MKAKELQDILLSTNLFVGENCIMIEKDSSGNLHNVHTGFDLVKSSWHEKVKVKIYRFKSNNDLYVDFSFHVNLFYSDKLKDLTIPVLIEQLDKFLSKNVIYNQWKKLELRDLLLNKLIND